ncbi:hypothetical protein [Pseudomonas sp. BN607]|uniref:hypothetical protein n=1 Tax=Pseudomonas sp. BN607 TaxID=2567895 RepID=UPI00245387EB|nr:hypothetical protein [Pseudomonas sp. BN607]MDH4550365.1 hypothetical protein [Pseudomonas sp. BN607]MDH4550801.1 hypothetical protein [Pseudomonas sp. BN607]
MKTVSFQGTQLSPGQQRRLEQQRQVQAFMNPVLAEQVAQTIKVLEVRKEQGAKPEKQWTLVSESRGTTCIADWMGY